LTESARENVQQAFHAAARVFMQTCVPGHRQRQSKIPGQAPAQQSHVARAGDVDHFGAKRTHLLFDAPVMAHQERVALEVGVKKERKRAALELQNGDRAIVDNAGGVAAVNAQERYLTPAGEGLKLAAGMRDAIHLVKGIGQKSHPKVMAQTATSESDQTALSSRARRKAERTVRRSSRRMAAIK
jgi:hypothetical protein